MIVTLHTQGLHTLEQVRAFIAGNAPVAVTLTDRASAHAWMADTRIGHFKTCRRDMQRLRRSFFKNAHALLTTGDDYSGTPEVGEQSLACFLDGFFTA